jgi:hypothetical protein
MAITRSRYTGERRCPQQPWILAFVGKARRPRPESVDGSGY